MTPAVKQAVTTVQFPAMRLDLRAFVGALADEDHQRTRWLSNSPSDAWDNFDEAIHFLYDDTSLSQDPARSIGKVLADQGEADAVERLVASLDRLFERHGLDKPDAAYMASGLWTAVVDDARALVVLLSANDAGGA